MAWCCWSRWSRAAFVFEDATKGGVVARDSVEKGLAMGTGVLAGYPVVDVKQPDLRVVPRRGLLGDGVPHGGDLRLPGGRAQGAR